jgi:type II secretory pathway predicted ATPase ExeA/TPR repeat protein
MNAQRFDLGSNPFEGAVPANALFRGESFRAAHEQLRQALRDGHRLVLLTAATGAGKTTLLHDLLAELDAEGVPTAYLAAAVDGGSSAAERWAAARWRLLSEVEGQRRPGVVVLDDAENLPKEIVADALVLAGSGPEDLPVSVVLGGTLALLTLVGNAGGAGGPRHRIVVLEHIKPAEVGAYVRARLEANGAPRDLFDSDAVCIIASYSGGLPERINRLCSTCLELAARSDKSRVSLRHAEEAAVPLFTVREPQIERPKSPAAGPIAADRPAGLGPVGRLTPGPPLAGVPATAGMADQPAAALLGAPLQMPETSPRRIGRLTLAGAAVAALLLVGSYLLFPSSPERNALLPGDEAPRSGVDRPTDAGPSRSPVPTGAASVATQPESPPVAAAFTATALPAGAESAPASSGPPAMSGVMSARLVARGDALLAEADVVAARLYYRRAAESGNAAAMAALAATYDPAALEKRGIVGIAGDAKTAVDWYRRAVALGHVDALPPLRELAGRLVQAGELAPEQAQMLLASP